MTPSPRGDAAAAPWFTDSNFSSIIGSTYDRSKLAGKVAAMREQFEQQRPLIESIMAHTGFSPANISTILTGSKDHAMARLAVLHAVAPTVAALTRDGGIPPSQIATMMGGKAKQLPEVLEFIEAHWSAIAAVRAATADTRPGLLTSTLGNAGFQKWGFLLDQLAAEYATRGNDPAPSQVVDNPIAAGRLGMPAGRTPS